MADPVRPDAVAGVRPLVEHFEGCNLTAYQDEVGVWTIGYGHTADEGVLFPHEGMIITKAQADGLLTQDLERNAIGVDALMKSQVNDAMFGALVSFAFNLGLGNLHASSMLGFLNRGDFFGAAGEFPKWNHAGGNVQRGLTLRRASEQNFFCGFPGAIVTSSTRPRLQPQAILSGPRALKTLLVYHGQPIPLVKKKGFR